LSSFRTIARPIRHEIEKIKGSRFIALAAPVSSASSALAFVAATSEEFDDATHVCWAYRLGARGDETRSSDAGEPSGSAGRPILQQITSRSLTNTAVAVVRYFGGTKLGVGGLVRAYGRAAAEVLARAEIEDVVITRPVAISYPYSLTSVVDAWLAAERATPRDAAYGEGVRVTVDLPEDRYDAAIAELRERSGGRIEISDGERGAE